MRALRDALDVFWRDVVYAARCLKRSPGVTAAMLTSLAVGVGANVATFTVLDRVLFQAPPGVKDPGTVRRIRAEGQRSGEPAFLTQFSYPALQDFKAAAGDKARIEGYWTVADRTINDDPVKVNVAHVTAGYFDLLGVQPERGRFFAADETSLADVHNVAVISRGLWTRAFGEDPTILGRTIRIDSTPTVVIGIAQEGFEGVDQEAVGAWAPLPPEIGFSSERFRLDDRGTGILQPVARLNPRESAVLEDVFTAALLRNNADRLRLDQSWRVTTEPLLEARSKPTGFGSYNVRNLLLAKRLAVVGLAVLLVAVANVASLLLMRTIRRRHEIAIRLALGASRQRLASQAMTESVVLATIAAVVAVLIGWWVGHALRSALVFHVRWSATPFVHRAVILAAALAVSGGLAAVLLPAVVAVRRKALEALRYSDAAVDPLGSRLRFALLVVQAAVCVALLSSGGAFFQSLRRAAMIDVGLDADQLTTIGASGRRISATERAQALARIRALPSVSSVVSGSWDVRPQPRNQTIAIRGVVSGRDSMFPATWVDSNYFKATGFRVLLGRGIDNTDLPGSELVAVITESMAKAFWAETNPVGTCLTAGFPYEMIASIPRGSFTCFRIVGIMRDVRFNPSDRVVPHVYLALSQTNSRYPCCWNFVVKTAGPPSTATVEAIRGIISEEFAPGVGPPRIQTVAERIAPFTKPWRAAALLLLVVGALAVLSTAAGIYGMVSYDVAQRTRELGVRIAMGATSRDILATVLASASRAVGVGIAGGLLVAILGGRLFGALLFETASYDPLAITAAVITIIATTAIASLIGARRTTTLDPAMALRSE